ncbi:metal ABC transporter substrate-binding protein [Candidatus Lokiarchaeum ossiferum]|uniref:metal ABC transporter substrate-binding protein n=1 Tax=Candidatus Lokiarchaeum ossiferum TaxID=2951803 RepID=UPI00352DE5D1
MKNHKKVNNFGKISILVLFTFASMTITLPLSMGTSTTEADPIQVVTSITILQDFVQEIAGDQVEVYSLVDGNEDPHTYEPNPTEIQKLIQADYIILMGREDLEPYWEGSLKEVALADNPNLKIITVMNATMEENDPLLEGINPHGWTSPIIAKMMVENIYAEFQIDANFDSTALDSTYNAYQATLDTLYQEILEFKPQVEGLKVVLHHPSMMYLLNLLGIERVAVIQEKEGSEPSAKHIQDIQQIMIEQNISIIINQPNLDVADVAQLARDTNAKIVNAIPLLGMTGDNNDLIDTYAKMIRYNLWALVNPQEVPGSTSNIPSYQIEIIFGSMLIGLVVLFKRHEKS